MFMVCQFWNLLPLHLNRKDKLNSMIKPLETLLGEQLLMIYNSFIYIYIYIYMYILMLKCLFDFAITCLYVSVFH